MSSYEVQIYFSTYKFTNNSVYEFHNDNVAGIWDEDLLNFIGKQFIWSYPWLLPVSGGCRGVKRLPIGQLIAGVN